MDIKELAKGAIITILIGGSAYTISQTDIVNNFAEDTGLTQEQAEQYVGGVSEDELFSFDVMGSDLLSQGREMLKLASEIDCVDFEYEWESITLSCQEGKKQLDKLALDKLAKDYTSLGQSYVKLASDSASKDDIARTISLIDQLNSDYELEVVSVTLDWATIDEVKKTNSYNKAVLKAALEND